MREEMGITKLFTDGKVKTKDGREFTRVIGGFGEGKANFLLWQAADLLGQETNLVTKNFNNNLENFEEGIDYIDLKSLPNDIRKTENVDITNFFKSMGITHHKYGRATQWLAFSFAGMMKLVKIATTKESWNIYNDFLEDYFKTKAENTKMKDDIEEELLELENERFKLLGIASYNPNEDKRVEAQKKSEELNMRIRKLSSHIDNKNLTYALKKQARLAEDKKSYILLADFGDRFNCKIGAKIMGKILRLVGICKKSKTGITIPYRESVPKYAFNNLGSEISYVYNYNECIKVIDNWMIAVKEFDRFYSIVDSDVMELYINNLCEKYFNLDYEEQAAMEF